MAHRAMVDMALPAGQSSQSLLGMEQVVQGRCGMALISSAKLWKGIVRLCLPLSAFFGLVFSLSLFVVMPDRAPVDFRPRR